MFIIIIVCLNLFIHFIDFISHRYEELQTDFEEYQLSSRELENELETQLAIYEKRLRELESKNLHLADENEKLRNKFEKLSLESRIQLSDLQKKFEDVSLLNEQLTNHIRDLEQSNDDLERAKRHLDATLSEFDSKLNEQIERNELLESEIGEKEELQVVIQRLKDEARDLRLELMIQQSFKNSKKSVVTPESENIHSSPTGNKKVNTNVNGSASITNGTPESKAYSINSKANSPSYNTPKQSPNQIPLLSASSRISALNIVSDLLRKVGALESKLASCRNIVPISNSMLMKNATTIKQVANNSDNSTPVSSPLKDIKVEPNF